MVHRQSKSLNLRNQSRQSHGYKVKNLILLNTFLINAGERKTYKIIDCNSWVAFNCIKQDKSMLINELRHKTNNVFIRDRSHQISLHFDMISSREPLTAA